MDQDLIKAKHFYLVQKIHVSDIKKTPLGSFDVFEVYPEFGVKLDKLSRALNDFALYMGCNGSPDGEFDNSLGCYRIRLQRRKVDSIPLSSALAILPSGMLCPIVLGCTATGSTLLVDQGAIPNTLVAGAPGSGKSTLLKVMIENLLVSNAGVVIIDPKIVDFAEFKKRSMCRVESDMDNVPHLLDLIISRMNNIYITLAKKGHLSVAQNNSSGDQRISPEIIIIDEWADVFLSNKECLKKVLLISQKGRAAGISVILATQRPSASILPGQIKANFTGRIAMRVSSELESRMIINSSHAAHISESGMGYYQDQSMDSPVYFRVAINDLSRKDAPQKPTSFWSNLMSKIIS